MKTLNDFVDCPEATITIIKSHHESGYIAFAAYGEYISKICDMLTGSNEEMANIRYGIFETDWYPVGFGKCIEEAIIDLNIRVSAFISDDGMVDMYNKTYGMVLMSMFYYDHEISDYVFNDALTHKNFPNWLRRYSLLNMEDLTELFKQRMRKSDA